MFDSRLLCIETISMYNENNLTTYKNIQET